MPTKGKLRDHKDSIITLYNTVGTTPFYTQHVKHLISPRMIGPMTMKHLLEPTGEKYKNTSNGRTYNQWKFSDKGIAWITSFQP